MTAFLDEDFLLNTATATRLYHEHAEPQPVFDFHCHLSPRDIAEDRQFSNLAEIWLEGDHYKWRAMRANGVPEQFCTGDAPPYEKFLAWAKTVPYTLRNPLYHWTHLELQRYFGISDLLDETTAASIWERANVALASGLSARSILTKFRVAAVCTTDDPTDDLRYHRALAQANLPFQVVPTFRPDQALRIDQPAAFLSWLEQLSAAANVDVHSLAGLLRALSKRHDYFHWCGCRLSDHGLERCHAAPCNETAAAQIFAKALAQQPISPEERERYRSFLMLYFAHLDAEKGWTKQLHLGARRNVNTSALHVLGSDTGFDTIGDYPQGAALSAYLDVLEMENALPQIVLYNSNPADTPIFAAVAGSFQAGAAPGENSIWPGVVVSRSKRRYFGTDQCAFELRLALPLCRHDNRFAFVSILPTARVLPADPLQHRGARRHAWRDSYGTRTVGRHARKRLLPQCAAIFPSASTRQRAKYPHPRGRLQPQRIISTRVRASTLISSRIGCHRLKSVSARSSWNRRIAISPPTRTVVNF